MPPVKDWLKPKRASLDIDLEMPDGRSMPIGSITGREAEVFGPVEAARTAMAVRDTRRSGILLPLSVDLRLLVAGHEPVRVPMFNTASVGLRALLAELASAPDEHACVYDDLDQGWGLRLDLRGLFFEVVEWDWGAESAGPRIAWRLPRAVLQTEAIRAAARFGQVHAALVMAAGTDYWSPRW